jgi:hypothetical protein
VLASLFERISSAASIVRLLEEPGGLKAGTALFTSTLKLASADVERRIQVRMMC